MLMMHIKPDVEWTQKYTWRPLIWRLGYLLSGGDGGD
jgi:hypothetical protein